MYFDLEPRDGDFARYVEMLSRDAEARLPIHMTGTSVVAHATYVAHAPDAATGFAQPTPAKPASPVYQAATRPDADASVQTVKREFMPLIKYLIIAFLLFNAGAIVGDPYGWILMLSGIALGIHAVRQAIARGSAIRDALKNVPQKIEE